MGIPIIHIITTMGITLMAPFRSIMISMIFIISVMMAIVTLAAVILVVILMGVTAVVVTAGGGALDRQTKAGVF
jgi:hypothetical protein